MRRIEIPVENVAQIAWGVLVVVYLVAAGRVDLLRPEVVVVFALSAFAAFLELYLRRIEWPYIIAYDCVVWSVLLTSMVLVTGGRGSEVWPAYILMSLTAPVVMRREAPYLLLGTNAAVYVLVYLVHNPFGVPLDLGLLVLRIGTIFLVAYVVDRFSSRERKATQRAIQMAHNRVTELVQARDAERSRIAGDIHDWLGTGIVAPMRKLEMAVRTADPEQVKLRVEEAVDLLRRSHAELRRVMENLHPHLLEQMGLAEGLRAYLQEWGEEHGVAVDYIVEAGPEPPAELALAVFRIQQEALNNAAKHAAATRVSMRLILQPDRVRLLVSDDGRGFLAAGRHGGRGLATMRERASMFGGTVMIRSFPGQGTTVDADLPVPASQ
ncbi:MAG: sensor histidine kinase [Bacillota bacterium]